MSAPATRRSLLKGGAILAAPLAAAAPAAFADDGTRARLQRLEDEAAIRDLHRAWLADANAAPTNEPEAIEISRDGLTATGRYACVLERLTALPKEGTFAQMAHLQGSGHVRSTERRLVTAEYAKSRNGWTIAKVTLA